jgi:agmatinase
MSIDFPNYFADADADFNEADFVIFGVPYDKTSSFRLGTSQAPKEIRKASWNFETFNLKTGIDLKDIKFHDYGDVKIKDYCPKDMVKKISEFTSSLLKKNKFPIAIGGEHSITSGIIQAYPDNIAVLLLDAHLDFRQQYESEVYNHACVTRRIADYIDIGNIVMFGVRSAEKEEFKAGNKKGLFYIDSFFIWEKGIKKALEAIKKHFKDKQVYLTLDMDVLDPAFAPGTSTPQPFGITPFDILECIDSLSSQLIGFDIVEVCPPYDKGETSLLAAKLIRYVVEKVWDNKKHN